jgi:hypothetical protein
MKAESDGKLKALLFKNGIELKTDDAYHSPDRELSGTISPSAGNVTDSLQMGAIVGNPQNFDVDFELHRPRFIRDGEECIFY